MATDHVVSPNILVGFAEGRFWIHSTVTGRTLTSSDPELLKVLAAFAKPADPDVVAGASTMPEATYGYIADLTELGALATASETRSEAPPGQLVAEVLAPMAVLVDSLAASLAAIGPEVAESVRCDTGVGIPDRLRGTLTSLMGVQSLVMQRVPDWIGRQKAKLRLSESSLRLHLGSGSARLEGYVNIDVWPSEFALDMRWGLPFDDRTVEIVYLSHVLEHLYYPGEVLDLLREIHRVLVPGGTVRIVVPDIEACIDAYTRNDRAFFEGRRNKWPDWDIETRMESFLGFAGVGPHPGHFGLAHKWGYDYETVDHVLSKAGFVSITRSTYQGSSDERLRVDDASSYAGESVGGTYYSLFVEARKLG